MEVRNLTDPPYKAGVELSQVIQTHVKPVPAFTELYEAAPSQSCACLYYRPDYPSLALVCQQHSLINSSLVVLKLTFVSQDAAAPVRPARLLGANSSIIRLVCAEGGPTL